MKIQYTGSVKTPAGWRSVRFTAEARAISAKMICVDKILEIDGEMPGYGMSRTGARRQEYNGKYFAEAEMGKNKRLSTVQIIEG
jgi:hypothetical protein